MARPSIKAHNNVLHIILLHAHLPSPLTFTYDIKFPFRVSCGHEPYTHKIKFKGQSVQQTEWKQTDRQIDKCYQILYLFS